SVALLSAFAEVLTAWGTSPRFSINVTLQKRLPLHPHVNAIIGDFTTLVPLAVDNSSNDCFLDRAIRIQSQLLEDMEHRSGGGIQVLRDAARAQGKGGGVNPIVFTSLLSSKVGRSKPILWMGEVVYGITQTPQVWLDHQVSEENGALVFNWD